MAFSSANHKIHQGMHTEEVLLVVTEIIRTKRGKGVLTETNI